MRPWSPILPRWSPSRTQCKDCRAGHEALATAHSPGRLVLPQRAPAQYSISICRVS
jgi:hypothetical protein